MRPIIVVPQEETERVRRLLASGGWEIIRVRVPRAPDADAALAAVEENRPVMLVPRGARAAKELRRILVPHEGSPRVVEGVKAADEAAVKSGAQITVLHVPSREGPPEHGSLPAPRLADHGWYDWAEWRAEFLRRFCRCSEGVSLDLQVATGSAVDSILETARRLPADLVVMTLRAEAGSGRAPIIRGVASAAPCPVLVLRGVVGLPWPVEGEHQGRRTPGDERTE